MLSTRLLTSSRLRQSRDETGLDGLIKVKAGWPKGPVTARMLGSLPHSLNVGHVVGWSRQRWLLAALAALLAAAGCSGSVSDRPGPSATATSVPPTLSGSTSAKPAAATVTVTGAVVASATATPIISPSATLPPPSPTAAVGTPTESATPTPTLAATDTPVPTVPATPGLPPTATATAAAPTAVSTTPAAGYPVAPEFAGAIRDFPGAFLGVVKHTYPGQALEPAHETKLSTQAFGSYSDGFCGSADSLFLWREDTRQIYFLVVGNRGLHMEACRDFWDVFPDTWKPGDPNNEDLQAPEGSVVPTLGFGQVWRQSFYGQIPRGLGFPPAPERYVVGTVQQFERAAAFYFPDTGAVYVLFDPFNYVTRGGDSTARVWFQVD